MRTDAALSTGGSTARPTASISVVIPAYNASAYLAQTLDSVASQSLAPLEVVVVDDGSKDDTAQIARAYNVRLISQTNSGISAARNAGIHAAAGEYIALLDSDDLWAPEKLAVQYASLQAYGKPAFCFTDYRIFTDRGTNNKSGLWAHPAFRDTVKRIGKKNTSGEFVIADNGVEAVLPDCYIQPSALIVRRADVLASGGFDRTIPVGEDWEFFLRLFKCVPGIALMRSLMLYRKHPGGETANYSKFILGQFDIARRLAADPAKYPQGDVRYMATTDHVRYFRFGIELARREKFAEAADNLAKSVAARPTPLAVLALAATRICQSPLGQPGFLVARTVWKRLRKR